MAESKLYKVRLSLSPQPDGGYVVTSPDLPELVTEGETAEEALANVRDALAAVRELYEDLGKPFPEHLSPSTKGEIVFDALMDAA